eukprot:scaffold1420_cov375-Pavlova_lutheri.AAC.4
MAWDIIVLENSEKHRPRPINVACLAGILSTLVFSFVHALRTNVASDYASRPGKLMQKQPCGACQAFHCSSRFELL